MKSIRAKILFTVLALSVCSIGIVAAVTLANLHAMRGSVVEMSDTLGTEAAEDSGRAIESQILQQLALTAADKADYADAKMNKQQLYTHQVADYLTQLYTDPESYHARTANAPDPALHGTLSAQLLYFNETIDPAAVAGEVALTANTGDMLLSIARSDPEIECGYFAAASGFSLTVDNISGQKTDYLDCPTRGWYQAAMAQEDLIWTDVFDDAMGRGLAITCAAPYRDGEGEIRGVVAFGSLITTLSNTIIETRIGETGYAFVVNEQGQTIISPNIAKDENGKIIRENLTENESGDVRELAAHMLAGNSGVARLTFEGREVYMAYEPMEVLPWTVVTVMDVDEALSPAAATRSGIEARTARTVADTNHSIRGVTLAVIVVLIASVLAVVAASAVLAGRITRPIARLLDGVGRISGGDLDAQIPVETHDEIGTLADAFNRMTGSLKKYISDLTAVTAEKERIGAELNVATDIQASMLPSIFPAFPDRTEFDIYATMVPAKEVGGDFYDFFMVDGDHLGIVMADVSGKGVPAALFMVIAKTLIKNHAQNGEPPEEVFTSVNDQLCESNDAGMFVTGWMAVLNLRTGELTYANAGHNPPLLRREGGSFEYLRSKPGFVLAGLEGMQYTQSSLTLERGDALYLYTDGVTEATDLREQLYGEDRLRAVLNANSDVPLSQLLAAVKADVDAFVGEAPQFDDITMLALRYRGKDE